MAGGGGGNQDLASIQKVVDALPELNRQKREVAKHVAICSDLSKRASQMFAVSEVQQELLMAAVLPSAPLPEAMFQQGTRPLFAPLCFGVSLSLFHCSRDTVASAVSNEAAPAVDRVNLIATWALRCRSA
jgi:hypothetical protein